ncbi:MAG: phosphotransferase family protein [Solirubrobacterales bacterium]|nr:phosphotransferase family protein [Solirubrobacterales bacterium]
MDGSAAPPVDSSIADALAPWLREATEDEGPFEVRPLAGGNSNETLLIQSPSALRVLRRPPAATIDASAHSVQREYRVLMALADTHVPVPRPIAVSREPTPGGPPGLLMEHLRGVSLTAALPDAYGPDASRAVAEATIDALADLHALPWRELGLADFGRPAGFLERQVSRWRRQFEACRHRELPDFERVATWLEGHRPARSEPGILHGDFHVDNCLFSPEEPVRLLAVIDWEMSTIGDPLLDVGLLLALWGQERCEPYAMPRIQGFSRAPGAPTRDELARRYEQRSGRSLEHLPYYMALALWKLAAIVEGAHLHFTNGALDTDYARELEHDVPRLLADARAFTELAA